MVNPIWGENWCLICVPGCSTAFVAGCRADLGAYLSETVLEPNTMPLEHPNTLKGLQQQVANEVEGFHKIAAQPYRTPTSISARPQTNVPPSLSP